MSLSQTDSDFSGLDADADQQQQQQHSYPADMTQVNRSLLSRSKTVVESKFSSYFTVQIMLYLHSFCVDISENSWSKQFVTSQSSQEIPNAFTKQRLFLSLRKSKDSLQMLSAENLPGQVSNLEGNHSRRALGSSGASSMVKLNDINANSNTFNGSKRLPIDEFSFSRDILFKKNLLSPASMRKLGRSGLGSSSTIFHKNLDEEVDWSNLTLIPLKPNGKSNASVNTLVLPGNISQSYEALKYPMEMHTSAMHFDQPRTHGAVSDQAKQLTRHSCHLFESEFHIFNSCDNDEKYAGEFVKFDGDAMWWHKSKIFGKPPRPRSSFASASSSHFILIFGGEYGGKCFSDLWLYNISNHRWYQVDTPIGKLPLPRKGSTLCYRKTDKSFYLFGGLNENGTAYDDFWKLEIVESFSVMGAIYSARWERIVGRLDGQNSKVSDQNHIMPPAVGYHSAVLVNERYIIFGGFDGMRCYSDLYVFNLVEKNWIMPEINANKIQRKNTANCAGEQAAKSSEDMEHKLGRYGHTATLVGFYMFIIGGKNTGGHLFDVSMINLLNFQWESKPVFGASIPEARAYHTTTLYDSRLYIIGGENDDKVHGDLWVIDLSGLSYLPRIQNFQVGVRFQSEKQSASKIPRISVDSLKSATEEPEIMDSQGFNESIDEQQSLRRRNTSTDGSPEMSKKRFGSADTSKQSSLHSIYDKYFASEKSRFSLLRKKSDSQKTLFTNQTNSSMHNLSNTNRSNSSLRRSISLTSLISSYKNPSSELSLNKSTVSTNYQTPVRKSQRRQANNAMHHGSSLKMSIKNENAL